MHVHEKKDDLGRQVAAHVVHHKLLADVEHFDVRVLGVVHRLVRVFVVLETRAEIGHRFRHRHVLVVGTRRLAHNIGLWQ